MRSVCLFAAGILVGSMIQGVRAQPHREAPKLNHVAITVPDLDEGIRF
jgi:hypothetical protein